MTDAGGDEATLAGAGPGLRVARAARAGPHALGEGKTKLVAEIDVWLAETAAGGP